MNSRLVILNRRLLAAAVVLSEIFVYHWRYIPNEGIQAEGFRGGFSFPAKIGIELEGGVPLDTSIIGYILFALYLYRNRHQLKEVSKLVFTITVVLTCIAIARNVHTLFLLTGFTYYYFHFKVGFLLLIVCGWMNWQMENKMEKQS
jgi:hypothetical protein